jgi:5-methyltetrahydrofolate--homocysteine methyltransferase
MYPLQTPAAPKPSISTIPRPTPPFWGTRILNPEDIPLEEVFWYLDLQALFVGQWQFRKPKEQSREEYDAFLERNGASDSGHWKARIKAENLLHPQIVYGYFPCLAEGNSLHIYDPSVVENDPDGAGGAGESRAQPLPDPHRHLRIPPPKIPAAPVHCRFLLAEGSGPAGPVRCVPHAGGNGRGNCHGICPKAVSRPTSTPTTSTTTGCRCRRQRPWRNGATPASAEELGYGDQEPDTIREVLQQRYQGSRYSFGYPACPNIADQYVQLDLLQVDRIGMHMDESEQLYPEQSTTAIITYHPAAKYFSA